MAKFSSEARVTGAVFGAQPRAVTVRTVVVFCTHHLEAEDNAGSNWWCTIAKVMWLCLHSNCSVAAENVVDNSSHKRVSSRLIMVNNFKEKLNSLQTYKHTRYEYWIFEGFVTIDRQSLPLRWFNFHSCLQSCPLCIVHGFNICR